MQYSESSQISSAFEPEFKRLTLAAISDPLLEEMAAYHLGWTNQNAGKRLRPLLLLAALQGLGADIKEGFSSAAAIELLHNATLVHDDIEDNGPSRHGQPALWKVYGQALALNFGDHLYALALGQLTHDQPQLQLALLHAFRTAFNQVISGQHLDISQSALNAVPAYLEMVRLKTGSLFALAFKLACICAGKQDNQSLHSAELAGFQLGVGFQIQDDVLGIWGEEEITGKSSSSDLLERKASLPVLLGLERSEEFKCFWNSRQTIDAKSVLQAKTALEAAGVLAECRALALSHFQQAKHLLAGLIDFKTPEAQVLAELIASLTNREA